MPLNYQQVRQQVFQLGENACQWQGRLEKLRARANQLLEQNAQNLAALRQKVQDATRRDPLLRCALPLDEPLDTRLDVPTLPQRATILAADGSQIFVDRHAEVQYGLVNIGAVRMLYGTAAPPQTEVVSHLFYDQAVFSMTEASLALERDLRERTMLAELAGQAEAPVITFTDGPMELWGVRPNGSEEDGQYQQSLRKYLQVLEDLHSRAVITAGYVDRPAADLVVRLLEVALAQPDDLEQLRKFRPLHGVTDIDLYKNRLQSGQRSAIFALHSQSAHNYLGSLALHFFYLNVGGPSRPYLARVEIPAWVADKNASVDALHAVLVDQCRIMGARPYPYLLHRAHETALVSRQEQEQVTQMIVAELLRRGLPFAGRSHKQASKDLTGRTRHLA